MKRASAILVFSLLTGLAAAQQEITVEVSVDAEAVSLDEKINLQVKVSASSEYVPPLQPWNPPPGIKATRKPGRNTGQSIVNRRITAYEIFTYTIQPERTGAFTLPPFEVKYQGDTYRSDPIEIEVFEKVTSQSLNVDPSQVKGVFSVIAVPDKRAVYRGEPVIVSYVYFVDGKSLERPKVTTNWPREVGTTDYSDFVMREIQERPPSRLRPARINDRDYLYGTFRRLVLYPLTHGQVQVPQTRFQTQLLSEDRFWLSRRVVKQEQVLCPAVTLEVKPLPPEGKPPGFSGAVGTHLSMTVEADKTSVEVGEAVTLKAEIKGFADIERLPDLRTDHLEKLNVDVHGPETDFKEFIKNYRIHGRKTFEFTLVPRKEGRLDLPALSYVYFDPEEESYKQIESKGIALDVKPSSKYRGPQYVPQAPEELRILGQGMRYIKKNVPDLPSYSLRYEQVWFWWLHVLGPMLVLAVWGYRRHLDRLETDVAYARRRRAGRAARDLLQEAHEGLTASKADVFYAGVSRALRHFVGDKLNIPAAGITPHEVDQALADKGTDENLRSDLVACLKRCDEARYTPGAEDPDAMERLMDQVEDLIGRMGKLKW